MVSSLGPVSGGGISTASPSGQLLMQHINTTQQQLSSLQPLPQQIAEQRRHILTWENITHFVFTIPTRPLLTYWQDDFTLSTHELLTSADPPTKPLLSFT